MLSYDQLSKKPLLFKSFAGLTVQEFDDIYEKEITKKYTNHELKWLSVRKGVRKREIGAGRPFKIDLRDRFFNVSCLLPTLHNLYPSRLSV